MLFIELTKLAQILGRIQELHVIQPDNMLDEVSRIQPTADYGDYRQFEHFILSVDH